MNLSLIIPAHNEADNLVNLISKIEESVDIPHELVIVNDHSTDNTAELLDKLCRQYRNIKVVENKLAAGFGNALKTGFRNCGTDLMVPIMGDLCDELSTVRKMYDKINEGYDIVCGSRYIPEGARIGGSRLKAFLSSWGGRSIHYLLGIPTHDIPNAFKMYRKKVIESIEIKSHWFEISMEIPLKAYYLGFKITEVPTVWRERMKGKSSFRVFKLLPNYLKLYIWAILMRLIKR
jgi:glycosyltransferase involved in cell wall biosynthesis